MSLSLSLSLTRTLTLTLTPTLTSSARGSGGGGSRSEAHSLGQTPKDLGTMIYLLGTQSNSMNARRLGNASR